MTARPSPSPTDPLAPRPEIGRVFTGHRKVRLGDVDPSGRLRLDALTRYTQDVSDDDTTDAGLDDRPGWVVRATVVDELAPAALGESLRFETFCSGLGSCWAERRLSIAGESGAAYEVATLWVCIDADSGRPHRLTEQFHALYGDAAGGRKVSAKQLNRSLPEAPPGDDEVRRWPLRVVDFDVYGHVNNAAYWAAVEQWAAPWSEPRRVRLEYGAGLEASAEVDIRLGGQADRRNLWWLPSEIDGNGRSVAASAEIAPLVGSAVG